MKGSELTLVFFTLLAQTAVGMFIAFGLVNSFSGWKSGLENSKIINDKVLFLICAILTAALIISFLHLGNIKNAYYALSNIATSWLSREIFFVITFAALTVGFTLIYSRNLFSPQIQNIVFYIAIFCGAALVFAMAKIYMLEVVPSWNSAFTPVSFYAAALIIGGLAFISAAVFLLQRQGVDIAASPGLQNIVKIFIRVIALLVIAELIAWLFQVLVLSNGERAAVESFNIIFRENVILFAFRIILQGIGLFFLISLYFSLGRGSFNLNYLYAGFVTILLAEIIGRYLFFAMYNRVGI